MKVIWKKGAQMPEVTLEEEDLLDAAHIQEMIEGKFLCRKCGHQSENQGWKALNGYLQSEKILLENKIKGSVNVKTDEGQTRIQVAKLVGFDHFLNMAIRVLKQAEDLRPKDDNSKEKEDDDERPNAYGD